MVYEIGAVYFLNALMYGMMLFLIASGLNLIFGVMGVVNLSHGSLYGFGAYVTAYVMGQIIAGGGPIYITYFLPILGAIIVGIVWGVILEPLLRRTYARPTFGEDSLLLTFGMMLVMEDTIRVIWGSFPLFARWPYENAGTFDLLGYRYPTYNLVVIAAGFLTAIILYLFLYRTKFGVVIRATSQNREIAQSLGVNVKRLFVYAFIIGVMLAGLSGGLVVPFQSAILGMGMNALVLAFVVVVIGGLGSIKGAFIGSLIAGIIRSWGIAYIPELELALLYLVAAAFLLWRPTGLFGE
ncbi:MAG: branched-chain amino acid ABC transporter permease [Candidatus Geothermarchaeales archaeon]